MKDKIFAYVPHSQQKKFEDAGWQYDCDLGYPHACYASLYIWAGDGEPVYPRIDISVLKPATKAQENDS